MQIMSHSSTSNSDRGDRAGLVLVSTGHASGELTYFARAVAVSVFIVGIASALIVDRFWSSAPIRLHGEEARQEVELRRRARIMDGSQAKLLEHDIRMTSGVRRMIIGPYAWALYRWMGHVKDGVILGDDGWLFLRNRAKVTYENRDKVISLGVANMAALERRLRSLGLDPYILPVPRKSVVHRSLLPVRIEVRPELDPKEILVTKGEEFTVGARGKLIASVESGPVAHTGDGALAVRVRGTSTVDLRVRLVGGGATTLLSS
jgi:hypothetical protein